MAPVRPTGFATLSLSEVSPSRISQWFMAEFGISNIAIHHDRDHMSVSSVTVEVEMRYESLVEIECKIMAHKELLGKHDTLISDATAALSHVPSAALKKMLLSSDLSDYFKEEVVKALEGKKCASK